MMKDRVLHAKRGVGHRVSGSALVATVPFSARYDLDRETGRFSRAGHPLFGMTICGSILIAPSVQGGVAGGWAFLAMKERGVGPLGLVFGDVNPVVVQGAVAAGLPLLAGIEESAFMDVANGDDVILDPISLELIVAQNQGRRVRR